MLSVLYTRLSRRNLRSVEACYAPASMDVDGLVQESPGGAKRFADTLERPAAFDRPLRFQIAKIGGRSTTPIEMN